MGAIDSSDENTICGAINYTIKYFKEKFPEANIIWATPTYQINVDEKTFMEYNTNLKEICNREGIEYFDLYTISGITKSNYNLYLYDGVHPNEEGKKYLTDLWINFLTN
jgi:lysophospholipase L1-like esterase